MTAQAALNSLVDRKNRNLAYFKNKQPNIYNYFCNRSFKNLKLNIAPDGSNFEILRDDKLIYEEDISIFITKEVAGFLNAFKINTKHYSAKPITQNAFKYPRFSHQAFSSLLKKLPGEDIYEGLNTPETLPVLVFTGVGTGLHIELTLAQRKAKHIVIFETDPDKFLLSLYLTEWGQVVESTLKKTNAEISFELLDLSGVTEFTKEEVESATFAKLWKILSKKFPLFPCNTYFYNHQKSPYYKKIINDVQKEIHNFMGVWGYYDDEINQFNNALHNVNRGMKILNKHPLDNEKPVIITGSGPSLANSIELIKSVRDNIILVSSGTSLKRLAEEGLIPDYHAEIESDYLTYTAVSSYDKELLKKIILLCPTQLNPLVPPLFKDAYYYLKMEASHIPLFNMPKDLVAGCTPSCVNSALASVIQMGYKNIFFTGTDFGFKNKKQHHVAGTIYDDNKEFSAIMENNVKGAKCHEVRDGINIYSTDFYYLCKSRFEYKVNLTRVENKSCQFFNLSDGLSIISAPFTTSEQALNWINEHVKSDSNSNIEPPIKLNTLKPHQVNNLKKTSLKRIKKLCIQITTMVKDMRLDDDVIRDYCYVINNFILSVDKQGEGNFSNFLRGSVWSFLYILYVDYLASDDKKVKSEIFSIWQADFLQFLNQVPVHFENYLDKDYSKKDPMIYRSIKEPEDISL
jgi:hypothetical protein